MLATLLVVVLLPLVGCGGDPVDAYCSQVQADRKELASITSPDASGGALLDALPTLKELGDKAPRDMAADWQTFLGALENLDRAITKAGVSPDDFKDGKPPSGVSADELRAISQAADQIGQPEVVAAVKDIEQQARDVCKVNIGL